MISDANALSKAWNERRMNGMSRHRAKEKRVCEQKQEAWDMWRHVAQHACNNYNQFAHGVDLFSQRISCYSIDRKSKRNWLRIFVYFLNASIFNSFICYNQLVQNKITYLDYMVSVAKSLCSGSERTNRGRPPSEKEPKASSPNTVLSFENTMHLPAKGKRRRCAYCSTREAEVRSNIECFSCKLAFCLKDDTNCFFEYHQIFM